MKQNHLRGVLVFLKKITSISSLTLNLFVIFFYDRINGDVQQPHHALEQHHQAKNCPPSGDMVSILIKTSFKYVQMYTF